MEFVTWDLLSLFNGTSVFEGYLMLKTSCKKTDVPCVTYLPMMDGLIKCLIENKQCCVIWKIDNEPKIYESILMACPPFLGYFICKG